MKRTLRSIVTSSLIIALFVLVAAPMAQAKHDKAGYIYGKVTTRTGNSYTGILRWDDEEAFWDDLFHSYKETRPYEDYLETYSEEAVEEIEGIEYEVRALSQEEAAMEKEEAKLAKREKKAKTANDRAELREERKELLKERKELIRERKDLIREQSKLERAAKVDRTLNVLGGAIEINFNEWSSGTRIFIARYGDIKKIEVVGSEDAELTMKTGDVYVVSGYSNDVGSDIWVRDAALGDIRLAWKKIETIEFMDTPSNVKPEGTRIYGKLICDAGDFEGFVQWDKEECLSTDILDGDSDDGRLEIPMGNITAIERRSRRSSWVTLNDGRRLALEGTNDVDGSNRGIYIEDARYGRVEVPWDSFEKLDFVKGKGSGNGYNSYKPKELTATLVLEDGQQAKGKIVFDLDESQTWEMLNGEMFDVEFDIPFEKVASITPRSRNSSMVEFKNGERIRLENSQDITDNNDGILIFVKGNKDPDYYSWNEISKIIID